MFFINQGRTRGTTFKIDTGGYVFSCLFDTGAKVSCMNVDTCTALGLLHSISDTTTQVNTASGQDMGVIGHVMVTFKLGKQSFTHKFLICRFLTRPFILGEDYLSKKLYVYGMGWKQVSNLIYQQCLGGSVTGSNGRTIKTL